ncbi:MAG: cereblon family protein [Desulfobacterales bacterium]
MNGLAYTAFYLRESPVKPDVSVGDPSTGEQAEPALSDDGEVIVCAQCGRSITTDAARISVNGAHSHTFANPHGIVFEIGCFRAAFGCAYQGPLTEEFTWFKGFGWRIAYCGTCMTHLGWLFIATEESRFHGLILDRLAVGKPNP